jgi:hypothetical protein
MAPAQRSRATAWLLTLLVAALTGAACLWIGSAAASTSRPAADSAQQQAAHTHPALGRWSSRTINSEHMWSVSCPAASFCIAAGEGPGPHSSQGYAYTYSHGKWSAGHRLDRHSYQDTVSCASPSFCVIVDSFPLISPAGYQGGYAFTYSRGTWSHGRKITLSLSDVSCAATSFCAAVGLTDGSCPKSYCPPVGGDAYVYSEGAWSHGHRLGRRQDPVAITCTSRSFCLALTTPLSGTGPNGYATYSRGTWSPVRSLHTVDGSFPVSVSCASARFCVATDDGGMAYVYSRGKWQPGVHVGSAYDSPAVSCRTSSFCLAVAGGWADVLSDSRWSGHTTIAARAYLEAVSCAAGPFCMAVGAGPHNPPGLAAWARYAGDRVVVP